MSRTAGPHPSKSAPQVYEAHDSDYEFDEFGNLVDDGGWDEDEEDDGAADAQAHDKRVGLPPPKEKPPHLKPKETPRRPLPDGVAPVPDEVYYDDLALVSCWQAAMLDYKYLHPTQFLPLREAPRKLEQKQRSAPLWYGSPSTSTSPVLQAKTKKRKKKRSATADLTPDAPSQKKQKQKEAVTWSPKSPEFQRAFSPPYSDGPVRAVPPAAIRLPVAGPHLPSPATFVPPPNPPASKIVPRTYPSPPPVASSEKDDSNLLPSDESPEDLLQNALWGWYNAGYQTALYHVALTTASGMGAEESERTAEERGM